MATIKKIEFKGMKDCMSIANGGSEIIVTLGFGPRILSIAKNGKPNHIFIEKDAEKFDKAVYKHYGGHRIWYAPETRERSYLPDNEPCVYTETKDGITIMSPRDKDTGIAKGFDVSIDGNGAISINNIVRNESLFDVEIAVWGITQFVVGGLAIFPQSKLDTDLIANRAVSFWPYTKLNDKRAYYGEDYITLSPVANTDPYKLGLTCDEKYEAYFNHGQLIIKEVEHYYGAEYPNYSCNVECYTNGNFIELESLSPMLTLEIGEDAILSEKIHIFDDIKMPKADDEKAIKAILDKALASIKGNK